MLARQCCVARLLDLLEFDKHVVHAKHVEQKGDPASPSRPIALASAPWARRMSLHRVIGGDVATPAVPAGSRCGPGRQWDHRSDRKAGSGVSTGVCTHDRRRWYAPRVASSREPPLPGLQERDRADAALRVSGRHEFLPRSRSKAIDGGQHIVASERFTLGG